MGGFLAALYDPLIAPLDPLGVQKWRRWVASAARGQVLEIGVGTGLNLAYYRVDEHVFGIDPDAASLERAAVRSQSLSVRVELSLARAEDLPFPDRHFDSVLNTLVFCTVKEPERALKEVKRVLKPGGAFRLIEHVRVHNQLIGGIQDIATPLWKRISGGCHFNRNTLRAVEHVGFTVQAVHSHVGGLFIGIDAINPPGH